MKGEHRTNVHRIHSLIQESKKDLQDKKLPSVVKKQIQEDIKELELVLDSYLNEGDEFAKRVYNMIYDELNELAESKGLEKKNS